jgi:Amt family ammonium transporter
MQAGFAMVEAGFTRAKNAVNILAKNIMDMSVGALVFFGVGFGVMFGSSHAGGFIGWGDMLLSNAVPGVSDWTFTFFLFQTVFAATAATIVSGAMAERTQFKAYLLYSAAICILIYPVSGHWAWASLLGVEGASGWLESLGFMDFAGSTVVHSVGGWVGLAGAIVLGPRIGKYTRDGISKPILGHNMPLAALGVFILWFGWFGFNPGSTTAGTDLSIARIAVTTCLAACAGTIGGLYTSWFRSGKPDLAMALNGALAGLVAITAPCANVSPLSSIVIGLIAGVLVVFSVIFIDHVLKIDDPVGAVSVHGVCGLWGTLACGLFAQEAYGGVNGLFFGGGLKLLGVQALGAGSVFLWAFGVGMIVFKVLDASIGLRVTREEEIKGLDLGEHGVESYAGFQVFSTE